MEHFNGPETTQKWHQNPSQGVKKISMKPVIESIRHQKPKSKTAGSIHREQSPTTSERTTKDKREKVEKIEY